MLDLGYQVLGPDRPPYRWFVMGGQRSGAAWHVDPNLTSAWNALLLGRKRWALYPPHLVPPGIRMVKHGREVEFDSFTALQWFVEVYPLLPPDLRPLEFVQVSAFPNFYVCGGTFPAAYFSDDHDE